MSLIYLPRFQNGTDSCEALCGTSSVADSSATSRKKRIRAVALLQALQIRKIAVYLSGMNIRRHE